MISKHNPSFFMIIADHDRKEFTVEGPMSDDTAWNFAVTQAQGRSRSVSCSCAFKTADAASAEFARGYGYKQVATGTIVSKY